MKVLAKLLSEEAGYSLVEVVVAIMILSVAIIPMVQMFDSALQTTLTSGNYDKARSFANQKLEQAKSLSYTNARTTFPTSASDCVLESANNGQVSCPGPATELPSGLTSYEVRKRFLTKELNAPTTDMGLMKVTVMVKWGNGNSYTTTGVVSE